MALFFPDLKNSEDGGFSYQGRRSRVRMYGPKLVENVVQALARIIVADQARTIAQRYRIASTTHDEIIFVAHENEADAALGWAIETMRQAPAWAEGLPLDAEGGYAKEYSK